MKTDAELSLNFLRNQVNYNYDHGHIIQNSQYVSMVEALDTIRDALTAQPNADKSAKD